MRKLLPDHLFSALFAVLISIIPACANADYGQSAVTFECHQREDTFILRLYILWNEDLDSFQRDHPSGTYRSNSREISIVDTNKKRYIRTCRTSKRFVEVSIFGRTLIVKEANKTIAAKKIDYVWAASGQRYTISSDGKHEWSECSDGVDGAIQSIGCAPLTDSETTNDDDIAAKRIPGT